ncbi:transcriptional regulator [Kribbella sp. NPDC026611]|uniref:winged helix-turn-helix domain-containing protein n=1 Tax=Kribbella sp. NPDC026611 TaxID=3154911 RepID=UPI0033E6C39E
MNEPHPRHKLDEIIHSPVRLSVMAVLATTSEADFRYVKDIVEVSDSLLSKHVAVLNNAGYVRIVKGVADRRPVTWLSLTKTGTEAYREYVRTLNRIISSKKTQDDTH